MFLGWWGRTGEMPWMAFRVAFGSIAMHKKIPRMGLDWKMFFGGGGWDRTTDLQIMSLTSYHCSTPRHVLTLYEIMANVKQYKWCQWVESNRRPQGYESCALPLSYIGTQWIVSFFLKRQPFFMTQNGWWTGTCNFHQLNAWGNP